ncbi:BnaC01g27120D [Brassica napus]|uniref:BnaC01g27120D protein n=1 Tax=Brassica napus TaxID=3708 RepID=A0A078FZ51_BRANA|nr:BnaC01g27120D [Brassica napus]
MGVSFAARKHPVLTTLRDTKARVTLVGEVALSIPSGQPGHERGGNGLPKKPAPGRGQHRMKGTALMLCWQSQLLRLRAEKSGRGDSGRGDWFFAGDKLASSQITPAPTGSCWVSPSLLNFPRSSARAV